VCPKKERRSISLRHSIAGYCIYLQDYCDFGDLVSIYGIRVPVLDPRKPVHQKHLLYIAG